MHVYSMALDMYESNAIVLLYLKIKKINIRMDFDDQDS